MSDPILDPLNAFGNALKGELAADEAAITDLQARVTALEAAQTPAAPDPPPPPIWEGKFNPGSPLLDATLYPLQSFVAGHASVVPDPLGSGVNVLKLAVNDSDRPYSGATAPRADFESPGLFGPGDERWIRIVTLIPTNVPLVIPGSGWMQFCEPYGKPYGGSPPFGPDVWSYDSKANYFGAGSGEELGYIRLWKGPQVDGKWHQLLIHELFATDDTGYVEFYFDGQLQTLLNGKTRWNMRTLDPGVNWDGSSKNFININQYRKAGMMAGTVTTYHGVPAVGATRESVEKVSIP